MAALCVKWSISLNCGCCRLEYEQRRDTEGPINQLSEHLKMLNDELVQVENREAQAKSEMEAMADQLEAIKQEAQELRAKAETIEDAIQERKKQGSSDTNELGKLKRQMTAKVCTSVVFLIALWTLLMFYYFLKSFTMVWNPWTMRTEDAPCSSFWFQKITSQE